VANAAEIDRLTLYFLTLVAASIMKQADSGRTQPDSFSDLRDSLNELNEMDLLQLQRIIEKQGQLETMISNVMKAGYEGGQAAVQALKAS
jgi:uncharacterized protein YdcH (DUF465 family)